MQTQPEQQRRKRVLRALANPVYFCEQYIRPYDPNWVSSMPDFAIDMTAFAVREKRGVIQLPPEFMKTTIVSQAVPIWLALDATAHGRLLRGLLMSEEERMAQGNLGVIKWHIENNERILTDFVDDRGRPILRPDESEGVWREDAIIVARSGASKDPTWQAKGLDSKGIHGRRLDVVIGDDVITPRNAASPALRKQALDTMELVLETRVVKTGRIIMAGNFNDDKDLLSTLTKAPGWSTFKRPAMSAPGKPDEPAKESELATSDLLWPDNWDRERLLERYRRSPNRFRRIFLMDPRAEHGERLNVNWARLIQPEETPLQYARFYMSVDPAPGGEGNDLDYFNVTVGALHETGFDLVESYDFRAPLATQPRMVGLVYDRYARLGQGIVALGVSKVTLDRYFKGMLLNERPDLEAKVEGISTPGEKEARLEALGAYAQSGWLRIWEPVWTAKTSALEDRDQELSLFEQWRDFPFGKHDDKLDGLDLVIRTAREFNVMGDVEWSLEVMES